MRLTVADTARVFPANRGRVFEAFFTTKPSVGTGLGLWAAKELVNKHEGKIRFRSRVGRGTVFTVGSQLRTEGFYPQRLHMCVNAEPLFFSHSLICRSSISGLQDPPRSL